MIFHGSTSYRDLKIVVVKFLRGVRKTRRRVQSLGSVEQTRRSRWGVPWLVQPGEEKAEHRPKSSNTYKENMEPDSFWRCTARKG